MDVLPDEPRRYLEGNLERMMMTQIDVDELDFSRGVVTPYIDPVLARNRRAHLGLFRRLRDVGLLGFTTRPLCRVDVSFVWKNGREQQPRLR